MPAWQQAPKNAKGIVLLRRCQQLRLIRGTVAGEDVLGPIRIVHVDVRMQQPLCRRRRLSGGVEVVSHGVHGDVVSGVGPAIGGGYEDERAIVGRDAEGVAAVLAELRDGRRGDYLEADNGKDALDGRDGSDLRPEERDELEHQRGAVLDGHGAELLPKAGGRASGHLVGDVREGGNAHGGLHWRGHVGEILEKSWVNDWLCALKVQVYDVNTICPYAW
jgi:hypothetical protein